MKLTLHSEYQPTGDQPQAIKELTENLEAGERHQTLLGVTGSGKTFTAANVIQNVQKPTLIISHNKTLAAQLFGEFKQFFPDNAVEYFISYYDYYQPEAYIASSGKYIEKELMINQNIEKLRLRATSSLLSGRRDVIVVASVSCIYGLGNPADFRASCLELRVGDFVNQQELLHKFVEILYSRATDDFGPGTFRVNGDTIEIFPPYADDAYRIYLFDDEIEAMQRFDPETGKRIGDESMILLFPSTLFVTPPDVLSRAMVQIREDMKKQVEFFIREGKFEEAERIEERTKLDLEMMQELGYCPGIENYSRYFDGRTSGERSFCLFDYFPDDFLVLIDESHVTIPQIRAMWGGDRSRKVNLVDYGFRLPAALDNRPLKFSEFEGLVNQAIYISATPGDYELQKTEGAVVEQIIRPTGLLDPMIEVRPTKNQIDDLLDEVDKVVATGDRVLITTLTKRMAEELTKYLQNINVQTRYLHSDIKALERVEIIRDLRLGKFDVLVGVNMLREGLDLPEVSLVAILDADKEGFLRNERSLVQTIGRAARNDKGRVLMYAEKITPSMERAISETNRRRELQEKYNQEHGITPQTVRKSAEQILQQTSFSSVPGTLEKAEESTPAQGILNDPVILGMSTPELEKQASETHEKMLSAAEALNFMEAARFRDEWQALSQLIEARKK